jgi:uroporphyrinogen decarboxylase
MNKRERVYAALEGEAVDQVPLTLWRHFHKQDQTPAGLASATLAFYHKFNLDLIKLTPYDFYAIEDWGADIVPAKDNHQVPTLRKLVIQKPEDWRSLTTLSPHENGYGQALEAVRLVTNQLGDNDAPVLMTIFNPLTIAYQLAGEKLWEHIQTHSTEVHIGLATIAETTSRFAQAVIEAGADGISFTSAFSEVEPLTEEVREAFVIRYDLIALERVKIEPVPLVLHLAEAPPHLNMVNQYPVHAVSWQNHNVGPSIEEALASTDKTLITGLAKETLEHGQPAEIIAQANQAITQTGGQRLILASAQELSAIIPEENVAAITHLNHSNA